MRNIYSSGRIRKLKIWETIGAFWIIIVGSLLHFVYDWSGKSVIMALIAPVNESVWEHLKLGYWSLILFCLIEYWYIKYDTNGFYLGKALGILTLELFIIAVFYTYTPIVKKSILWIDIGSYILGAVFCQIVSYSIIKRVKTSSGEVIGGAILIAAGIVLIVFTFYPPHLPIFMDPISKGYGIVK